MDAQEAKQREARERKAHEKARDRELLNEGKL